MTFQVWRKGSLPEMWFVHFPPLMLPDLLQEFVFCYELRDSICNCLIRPIFFFRTKHWRGCRGDSPKCCLDWRVLIIWRDWIDQICFSGIKKTRGDLTEVYKIIRCKHSQNLFTMVGIFKKKRKRKKKGPRFKGGRRFKEYQRGKNFTG